MRSFALALTICMVLAAWGSSRTSEPNQARTGFKIGAEALSGPKAALDMPMLAAPSLSGAEAAEIMHERHEGMGSMGKDLKALQGDLDSHDPDMSPIRSSADDIAKNAKAASHWFPIGTGPEAGKTAAKPEIWQTPQDFAAKLSEFQAAAQKFSDAALAGDANRLKANLDSLAGTCKACHEKYRTPMHH